LKKEKIARVYGDILMKKSSLEMLMDLLEFFEKNDDDENRAK
jgi:hypothetical protein